MSVPKNFTISMQKEELRNYIEGHKTRALVLLDQETRIQSCSYAFRQALGFKDDIIGKLFKDVLRLKDYRAEMFHNPPKPSSKNKLPRLTMMDRFGLMISSDYSLTLFEQGLFTFYVIEFVDLSQRQNLNLLQQFAGTFMNDVNMGVIILDTEFTLVDISDMACRVLGLEKQVVLNKSMDVIFASIPAEHQFVQRSILDGVITRNYAVSWMNNQERFELLLDTNVLKDEEGKTAGAYILFKDVSNLRSLEEQVQRSDRLAMIGQIAAGTAHEIRNPLTSIKGFLQVLKNTFAERQMDKERGYTDIMLKEIDRINELVSEFLLLSKRKHVSYEQVEIGMVLKEILPIINNEAILHNMNIIYEAAPYLPKVIADAELLKQVFLNIGKNGIEAMNEGGVLAIVERWDEEERKVHVDIHDDGPGIPNFLIDKIFDPFFTTKEEGTGLGLSVCQRIVHDMGGIIRVSSKGFGTTFTVSIPYS